MAEYYHGKSKPRKKSPSYPKFVRLVFKQTLASLVCGVLLFLMHVLPLSRLNHYADALGRALRYEYSIPTQALTDWFKERMPLP